MFNSSDRTSLTVENALIGHLISQDSSATNYYISSDKLIVVQKDGTTEEMTYKLKPIITQMKYMLLMLAEV